MDLVDTTGENSVDGRKLPQLKISARGAQGAERSRLCPQRAMISIRASTALQELFEQSLMATGSTGFSLQYGELALPAVPVKRVCWGERLDSENSVQQELESAGYTPEEVLRLLDEFDMGGLRTRKARQLPDIPSRQLQLLSALGPASREQPSLLVLKDPFHPFNGRWRERFAELCVQYVDSSGQSLLVLALSFVPNAWKNSAHFIELDLDQLTTAHKVKPEPKPAPSASSQCAAGVSESRSEPERSADELWALFVARSVAHSVGQNARILALGQSLQRMRSFAGIGATLCFVLLVLGIGIFTSSMREGIQPIALSASAVRQSSTSGGRSEPGVKAPAKVVPSENEPSRNAQDQLQGNFDAMTIGQAPEAALSITSQDTQGSQEIEGGSIAPSSLAPSAGAWEFWQPACKPFISLLE